MVGALSSSSSEGLVVGRVQSLASSSAMVRPSIGGCLDLRLRFLEVGLGVSAERYLLAR